MRFFVSIESRILLTHTLYRQALSVLAPTLFPFFRHTIAGVRLAVVKTLHSFMTVLTLPKDWISGPFLRLLFQNLIVEERSDVRDATLSTWNMVLTILRSTDGWMEAAITQQLLLEWYAVLMTPLGMPLEVSTFYDPLSVANGMDAATERHNVDKNMLAQDLSLISTGVVLQARVAGSKAMAALITFWPYSVRSLFFDFRSH